MKDRTEMLGRREGAEELNNEGKKLKKEDVGSNRCSFILWFGIKKKKLPV